MSQALLYRGDTESKCSTDHLNIFKTTLSFCRCLDSKFVVDGNIPDGSVIMYGKAFSKSWIIQNTGTKTWRNVQLVHQDGFLPIQREVDVPDLAPGQQV